MQEAQEYAQTQVSEERRQRDSQAKKRKRDSDVPEVIMERKQQDAQAKAAKCYSTGKRQQENQAMAAKHRSESLGLPGVQFPLGPTTIRVWLCRGDPHLSKRKQQLQKTQLLASKQ